MELLKTIDRKAPADTILRVAIKEELIPFKGTLAGDYYVLGDKRLRDQMIATAIAGPENIDAAYSLLALGGVPRGRTLRLVADEYSDSWNHKQSFNAIAYQSRNMDAMLAQYRQTRGEEPECMLAIRLKYANRIFVVRGSDYAHGTCIMGSGIPLAEYKGQYEESMLAIGRPLMLSEAEYMPLK